MGLIYSHARRRGILHVCRRPLSSQPIVVKRTRRWIEGVIAFAALSLTRRALALRRRRVETLTGERRVPCRPIQVIAIEAEVASSGYYKSKTVLCLFCLSVCQLDGGEFL